MFICAVFIRIFDSFGCMVWVRVLVFAYTINGVDLISKYPRAMLIPSHQYFLSHMILKLKLHISTFLNACFGLIWNF